jgi:hypothetical protein
VRAHQVPEQDDVVVCQLDVHLLRPSIQIVKYLNLVTKHLNF